MISISTKDDIYRIICNASRLETLGMFVGSGFTKSILENNFDYDAYNWAELLERCCDEMKVDKDIMKSKGSYPEIASKICKQYSVNEETKYFEAVETLKSKICTLTNVFPDSETQEKYSKYFDTIKFNWIVTTNYDTILESILCGKSLSISPEGCFTKIKNLIPIYHLHGIRNNPNSIVITNEDYAYLFRPNDYRQARLPFLMKESLVLMVGYGLGDINVITAVDWAKNVYTNSNDEYDFPIIQLLYTDTPKDRPYQDDLGITILEVNNLSEFFDGLYEFYKDYSEEYDIQIKNINEYIQLFNDSSDENIRKFIENTDNFRSDTIDFVSSLAKEFEYIYISYLTFLRAVINELAEMARPNGAFDAYDKKLNVILDIYEKVPLKKMPTSFFIFIARALDSVAYYIGDNRGQSWDAKKTWDSRKNNIPQEVIDELWEFVKSSSWNTYDDLRKILKTIKHNKTLNNNNQLFD